MNGQSLDNDNLDIVFKKMPSGGTASTRSNSAGVTFDIPVAFGDATNHKWTFAIDGVPAFTIEASGNGGGGITNFTVSVFDNLSVSGPITAAGEVSGNKFSITDVFTVDESNFGVFGVSPVGQQTGGAATAGATYTNTEKDMIQKSYDALRAFGFLT